MTSRRPLRLADFFYAARRHKLILIVPAVALAAATGITLRDLPQLYEATVRMRVEPPTNEPIPDVSAHIRAFRERIIKSQDPTEETGNLLVPDRVAVLVETGRDVQPGAFFVSYRDADPEIARRLADQMASTLVTPDSNEISERSAASELRKRTTDISNQLRELEARDPRLARSEQPFVATSLPVRADQPSAEFVRAQQITVEGLKDQQYKIQQQLADVDKRINTQKLVVEQQKKGPGLRDNPTYAVLIAKRTELQGNRDTLINRQELTDKHPRVLAITDQIAAINRQIEEIRSQDNSAVGQTPEVRELSALESERNRLKVELEVLGRDIARRSTNGPVGPAAADPLPVRRSAAPSKQLQHYLSLKRELQEAASALHAETAANRESGSGQIRVSMVQPAVPAHRPLAPNPTGLISIAAVGGLILGSVFTFFADKRRLQSLQDSRDVEYYTRLPLLAALPVTTTASERRSKRRRTAATVAIATATTVALTFALTWVFTVADIFAFFIKK